MDKIYQSIINTGKKLAAEKIVLFGSRARGDNRANSDIDIAVYGIPEQNKFLFREAISDLPTFLKFDIVFITDKTDAALIKNINKDGVILMSKFSEKLDKFCDAINRLEESIEEYEVCSLSSARDGVIQRFEFCTELAWKSAREFLISEGYVDLNSPKSVMRQVYADNLITDEQGWLELLQARNLTSHIYDENTAGEVFENIKNKYLSLFKELSEKLVEFKSSF
ncbi:MAG: toxin-antitoxin system, antitoxin component [Ruminococcaceae bacterium]|nr:toxin-antitoxin system, antitoxin component [Oscillospiraceae bacterium]